MESTLANRKIHRQLPPHDHRRNHDAGVNPYEVLEIDGNCLLNDGINAIIWPLVAGAGGQAINATNGCIGVGDSSTPAVASQTGLSASANRQWVRLKRLTNHRKQPANRFFRILRFDSSKLCMERNLCSFNIHTWIIAINRRYASTDCTCLKSASSKHGYKSVRHNMGCNLNHHTKLNT